MWLGLSARGKQLNPVQCRCSSCARSRLRGLALLRIPDDGRRNPTAMQWCNCLLANVIFSEQSDLLTRWMVSDCASDNCNAHCGIISAERGCNCWKICSVCFGSNAWQVKVIFVKKIVRCGCWLVVSSMVLVETQQSAFENGCVSKRDNTFECGHVHGQNVTTCLNMAISLVKNVMTHLNVGMCVVKMC